MIRQIDITTILAVPLEQIDSVIAQIHDAYALAQDSKRGVEIALNTLITYDDGEAE